MAATRELERSTRKMATLLSSATSNSNPASATGTATQTSTRQLIEIPGDSVFNGAEVVIQGSSVNTAGKFSPIGAMASLKQPHTFTIEVPIGHFVRALLNRAGSTTNITVNMLPIT